jgi:hypothetical protein
MSVTFVMFSDVKSAVKWSPHANSREYRKTTSWESVPRVGETVFLRRMDHEDRFPYKVVSVVWDDQGDAYVAINLMHRSDDPLVDIVCWDLVNRAK